MYAVPPSGGRCGRRRDVTGCWLLLGLTIDTVAFLVVIVRTLLEGAAERTDPVVAREVDVRLVRVVEDVGERYEGEGVERVNVERARRDERAGVEEGGEGDGMGERGEAAEQVAEGSLIEISRGQSRKAAEVLVAHGAHLVEAAPGELAVCLSPAEPAECVPVVRFVPERRDRHGFLRSVLEIDVPGRAVAEAELVRDVERELDGRRLQKFVVRVDSFKVSCEGRGAVREAERLGDARDYRSNPRGQQGCTERMIESIASVRVVPGGISSAAVEEQSTAYVPSGRTASTRRASSEAACSVSHVCRRCIRCLSVQEPSRSVRGEVGPTAGPSLVRESHTPCYAAHR